MRKISISIVSILFVLSLSAFTGKAEAAELATGMLVSGCDNTQPSTPYCTVYGLPEVISIQPGGVFHKQFEARGRIFDFNIKLSQKSEDGYSMEGVFFDTSKPNRQYHAKIIASDINQFNTLEIIGDTFGPATARFTPTLKIGLK